MEKHRTNAKLTGILFIVAAITSIIGLLLYDPLLNHANYLTNGAAHSNQILWGAAFELMLACSAIGTCILLFPYVRKYNESLALGYLCFRFFEAVLIVIGVISMLALLNLSQQFTSAAAPLASAYEPTGNMLIAVHDWTFLLGPNLMLGLNTMMYSYLLYRSKLIPRFIARMGLAGAACILLAAVLELYGIIEQLSVWGAILALPVAAYEMTLAVRLIVKGFNPSALSAHATASAHGNPAL